MPFFLIRSAAFAPPPSLAWAIFDSTFMMRSSMAFVFAWKSVDDVEMKEGRTEA